VYTSALRTLLLFNSSMSTLTAGGKGYIAIQRASPPAATPVFWIPAVHFISDLHGLRAATGGPSSRAGGCASLMHLAAGFSPSRAAPCSVLHSSDGFKQRSFTYPASTSSCNSHFLIQRRWLRQPYAPGSGLLPQLNAVTQQPGVDFCARGARRAVVRSAGCAAAAGRPVQFVAPAGRRLHLPGGAAAVARPAHG